MFPALPFEAPLKVSSPGLRLKKTTKQLVLELQKYYFRKGNRVIFSNGMSLNQLAWEMWERLGYQEIDPSVISRVLKGERTFTQKQLQCFCQILHLHYGDGIRLKEIFWEDYASKYGIDLTFMKNKEFLDIIQDNLEQIKKLRLNGHPDSVLEWGQLVCDKIDAQIGNTRDEKGKKYLVEIKGHILRERMRALLEVATKNEIKRLALPMVKDFKKIAILLKSNYFWGLSDYLLGEICYCIDERRPALNYFKKANDFLVKYDGIEEELLLLKCSAGIMAKDKNLGEYTKINDLIETRLPYFPNEFRAVMASNQVRCECILEINGGGLKRIAEAWRLYTKYCTGGDKLASLRKIQLIRTELEIYSQHKVSKNLSEIEKLGNEAQELSIKQGYRRYLDVFPGLLNNILN